MWGDMSKCRETSASIHKNSNDKKKDELHDTIKDNMEVETEPNVYEQYDKNVKQAEVKQLDDISAEDEDEKNVDVISRLIYFGVKTLCL